MVEVNTKPPPARVDAPLFLLPRLGCVAGPAGTRLYRRVDQWFATLLAPQIRPHHRRRRRAVERFPEKGCQPFYSRRRIRQQARVIDRQGTDLRTSRKLSTNAHQLLAVSFQQLLRIKIGPSP